MTPQQVLLIAPVLLAVLAGVLAMLSDILKMPRLAVGLAVAFLWAAAGVSVWGVARAPEALEGVLVIGGEMSVVWGLIFAMSALCVLGAADWAVKHRSGGGVVALMAFAAAGSAILAASLDLIMTLIALETVAVCSYALVAAARTARSREAAMKYIIQGAIATGLFLLGTGLFVGLIGGDTAYPASGRPAFTAASTNLIAGFASPAAAVSSLGVVVAVASSFILAAFAFKLGAFPFHSWAPDAFETAPPPASALMATAPKLAAFVAVFLMFGNAVDMWATQSALQPLVLVSALAFTSIVFGNLAALRQDSFTRMLGYSGIAQVGYGFVGVAVFAIRPTILLVTTYSIAVAGAFVVAQALRASRHGWDGSISGMAGLSKRDPLLAFATAACMFSLTGIPLTAGFWGKFAVFSTAVDQGLGWLAIVGVIGSVISFGFYGRVLRSVYFDDPAPTNEPTEAPLSGPAVEGGGGEQRAARALAVIWAVLVVAGGVIPLVTGLSAIVRS